MEGYLLGHVENLTYLDHDVWDLAKFTKFGRDKYMKLVPQPSRIVVFEEKDWDLKLKTLGILRLLDIPHFGRS